MNLVSIRMITDDLDRLVDFYERVTGFSAVCYPPTRTLSGIVEFKVDDVDAEYERLFTPVTDEVIERAGGDRR